MPASTNPSPPGVIGMFPSALAAQNANSTRLGRGCEPIAASAASKVMKSSSQRPTAAARACFQRAPSTAADLVPLREQRLRQVGQRRRVPAEPVPDGLHDAPHPRQRPLGGHQQRAHTDDHRERDQPRGGGFEQAAVHRAAQHAGDRQHRQPQHDREHQQVHRGQRAHHGRPVQARGHEDPVLQAPRRPARRPARCSTARWTRAAPRSPAASGRRAAPPAAGPTGTRTRPPAGRT